MKPIIIIDKETGKIFCNILDVEVELVDSMVECSSCDGYHKTGETECRKGEAFWVVYD